MINLLAYKAWMIEPMYMSRMVPILYRAMESGTLDQFFELSRVKQKEAISSMYAGIETDFEALREEPFWYSAKSKNGKKVAIIPMMGPITKNGDACSWGMRDYQNVMARIAKNDSIAAVVFHFNNAPGGTNDGTPEISHYIRNFPKATVAFADGILASAHYWMASQTKHIMANKLTETQIGSIGSLIPWQNIQNMIDAGQHPSMEIIRAPQSTNKAKFNVVEELTEELRAELLVGLQESVKGFIADVKKGRAGVLRDDKKMFTGAMYPAAQAVKNGLADSLGTLTDAINKAAQLTSTIQKSTSGSTGSQVISMLKFPRISALLGAAVSLFTTGSDGEAKELDLNEEQSAAFEAAEKKLGDYESVIATMKTEADAQSTKVTELEKTVSEQATQITTLSSEKTTLESEKKTLSEDKTKLEAKVTDLQKNSGTTILPNNGKEEKPAADNSSPSEKKSHRTAADDEADKYVNALTPTLSK